MVVSWHNKGTCLNILNMRRNILNFFIITDILFSPLFEIYGTPCWTRTNDPRFRRPLLYSTELMGHIMVQIVGLEPTTPCL